MFTIDFENLPWLAYIGQIVDILLVTYVVYKLIMIIRGTRAVQLVKGIAVIFMIWFVSNFLGLSTLEFITKQTATFGLLAIIIIFQPELRRGWNNSEEAACSQAVQLLKMIRCKRPLMPSLKRLLIWGSDALVRSCRLKRRLA